MLDRLKMHRKQDGFTIIEVLIVLAIAGLIMVVVFLAVPNLQKSQRNNARDTDANNLLQNVSQYIGNAGGNLPTTACSGIGSAQGQCSWISYNPQQLTTVSYRTTIPANNPSKSTAYLIGGVICDPNNLIQPTTTGATSRDYVVWYGIEGSTKMKCTQGS